MKSFNVEDAIDEAQRMAIFGDPIAALRYLDRILFDLGYIRWAIMELKGRVLELLGRYRGAVFSTKTKIHLSSTEIQSLADVAPDEFKRMP